MNASPHAAGAAVRFRLVQNRASLHKERHDLEVPVLGRKKERARSVVPRLVDVCTQLNQYFHDLEAALLACYI